MEKDIAATALTRDKIAATELVGDPDDLRKPLVSSKLVYLMNLGFFGVSLSSALQATAISPLFAMLGAKISALPILSLAGPVTGLLIQPLIGALSDRTWHPRFGRRRPYFVAGTILFGLVLFLFPLSSALWMGVLLLWLMDIGNNTAMEPYRALIADKLRLSQRAQGYLVQGMAVGGGAVLANLSLFVFQRIITGAASTGVPHWIFLTFWIAAVCAFVTVFISVAVTKELPPTEHELIELRAKPRGLGPVIREIGGAVREMPIGMHKLGIVYAFQWYGLMVYRQFVSISIGDVIFHTTPSDPKFADAVGWTGLANGWFSLVQIFAAMAMIPLAIRLGVKRVHAIALFLGAIGMVIFPHVGDKYLILIPLIGFGIANASIFSLPYVMATSMVPKHRIGVYLGILNMMIVVPQLIETVTFGWVYTHLLHSVPGNAIMFVGLLFALGALSALWVNAPRADEESPIMPLGSPRHITSVYKRVIVGSDGTPASLATVGHAAGIASAAEARLVVVSAYSSLSEAEQAGPPDPSQHQNLYGEEAALAAVDASIKELTRHRFRQIDSRAVPGTPSHALLEVAGKDPDNLIVVGNRGLGAEGGEALGSVPREVVKHAVCNVMIVQSDGDQQRGTTA